MVCPDHGTLLTSSTVAVVGDRQNEFVAATDDNCRAAAQSPSWFEAELTACYRRALIERKFVSAHGHVSERKLHDAFVAASAPMRNVLPEATEIEWLSSIVRKHRHAFHPLHHVLFRSFLDRSPIETTSVVGTILARRKRLPAADPEFAGRLRELVGRKFGLRATARALGVDANTIRRHAGRIGLATPWRDRSTASRPGKEAIGPAIRERWLALQRREPGLGRKSLAARLSAEHAWLYRHDRQWLELHSPPPVVRAPPARRIDWEAVDHDLAAALRAAAKVIVQQVPPVRITRAELERRLDRRDWIGRRYAKLPETVAELTAATETVEAFQIRRIGWAQEEIEGLAGPAPVWKIRRLAGLPARASAAVEQALHAASRGRRRDARCR